MPGPAWNTHDLGHLPDDSPTRPSFQRLRPELLASIFRLAAESTAQRIMVSAVCAHWRACAVEDASLWADLTTHDLQCYSAQSLFHLALERSKAAPLSVRLHMTEVGEVPLGVLAGHMRMLERHAARLRSLDVNIYGPHPWPSFLTHPAHLPLLEHLDYRSYDVLEYVDFRAPPRLRTLALVGVCPDSWDAIAAPNLSSCTVIAATFARGRDDSVYVTPGKVPLASLIGRFFARCPELQSLTIHASNSEHRRIAASPHAFSAGPALKEFSLHTCCEKCAASLRDSLHLETVFKVTIGPSRDPHQGF